MSTEKNKELIRLYNEEVIAKGNMTWFLEMSSSEFVNHSALNGMSSGRDGMVYFFNQILHASFSNIQVSVKDMLADGDKVATRKEITGVHTRELMGIPASEKAIKIKVIDIITIKDGKITEHWGENNFSSVLQSLQE